MNLKPLVQAGVAVVLLGVAAILLLRSCRGPSIDLNPYLALGTVAAEEAAGLIGGQGRLVLVVLDTGPDRDPVLEAQLGAFKTALKAHRGVELAAIEPVRMDPFLSMRTGGAMPPERYLEVRRAHPDAAGFVLFIAFPPLSDEELDAVATGSSARPAKVMVVSPALPTYDRLLRDGAFDLGIVSRAGAVGPAAAGPASLRQAFDQEYEILKR